MTLEAALAICLCAPLAQAVAAMLASRPPGLRDTAQIVLALVQFAAAWTVFGAVGAGREARLVLIEALPGVDFAFTSEPIGTLMALVISGLGALHAFHTAAFLRAVGEPAPARLQGLIALASAAGVALAFSANLFTFFVAYQLLVLTLAPLIAHDADAQARDNARAVMAILIAPSVALLLPAIVWTYGLAGRLDFAPEGLLPPQTGKAVVNVLLALYVFGLAALALPPLHRWLSRSAAASFPAVGVIQGVVALNAGGLGLLKISAYVFGPQLAKATPATHLLIGLACLSMAAAALIALSKQNLRERLAYTMMSQSAAVAVSALIADPVGTFAAALQIVAQSCAATTLVMTAATAFAASGRERAVDYVGLGRAMPWTFAAFAVAAASLIGLPPFAGAWAKLWLIYSAAHAGLAWAGGLIALAAAVMFAVWGPLAAGALGGRAPDNPFRRADGASILMIAPATAAAAITVMLLFFADPIARFLSVVWRGGAP